MFIPQADAPNLSNSHPSIIPPLPPNKPPRFSLDMSGVAGLLGGGDAVSAMATVHVYGNRRWLGWYNTPGSFQIAKRFRSLAKSTSFRDILSGNISPRFLSKSVHTDPMALFKLDSCKGPRFRAAQSGTVIQETGYLAALFMKECAILHSGDVVLGRETRPVRITIAQLGQAHTAEIPLTHSSAFTFLFASIPIVVSVGTCVLCAVFEDWYASSLILVGIIANGVSCLVLGSADFVFNHPEPAKGSPAGDGILGSGEDIVLLKGTEGAVNSITRGRFSLRFSSKGHYSLIQWCSLLFFIQFIAQLLLISQALLFGQVMFLASLGVSALYNARLSSLDKEKIHRNLLSGRVLENLTLKKYTLGTRTTAVVFMLLVLQLQDPTGLLNELLPNDTKVWRRWKESILERLPCPSDQSFLFESNVGDLMEFTQQEKVLLELLYEDARAAYKGYERYLQGDGL
ncbi:hypothetical protein J3R83DRAFT_1287 [Lanmaoa asiatica]|nr:hypothetical protein J3R83DRAFT_1287 [Lanmaoa asiatica]